MESRGPKAEQLWVRREVGDALYKEVEQREWTWKLMHSQSQTADRFCRCDIYVDIDDPDSKYALHFFQSNFHMWCQNCTS